MCQRVCVSSECANVTAFLSDSENATAFLSECVNEFVFLSECVNELAFLSECVNETAFLSECLNEPAFLSECANASVFLSDCANGVVFLSDYPTVRVSWAGAYGLVRFQSILCVSNLCVRLCIPLYLFGLLLLLRVRLLMSAVHEIV